MNVAVSIFIVIAFIVIVIIFILMDTFIFLIGGYVGKAVTVM